MGSNIAPGADDGDRSSGWGGGGGPSWVDRGGGGSFGSGGRGSDGGGSLSSGGAGGARSGIRFNWGSAFCSGGSREDAMLPISALGGSALGRRRDSGW